MTVIVEANGASIPAIGLGTGRLKGDVAIAAIHAALDSGYRHIDTAAKYGNEVEVGEAIRSHALPREEIFITTKVMAKGLAGSDGATDPHDCLKRLGVDHVDLLLLHWPDQRRPLGEQFAVLERARADGLARHVGVCNFPPPWLREAAARASVPIAANQVERHPYIDQSALAATCQDLGVALMAFSPMGRGALIDDRVIAGIAAAHGRSAAQVVLRWHMQTPLSVAVPSSSNPGRIAANLDIFDFALGVDDMAAIDALARPDGRVVKGPPGYDWEGSPIGW